jgi:hypothetical protein
MITRSKQVGRQIQSYDNVQAAWLRGTLSAPARVTRATPLAAKEEDRSDIGRVFQHVRKISPALSEVNVLPNVG